MKDLGADLKEGELKAKVRMDFSVVKRCSFLCLRSFSILDAFSFFTFISFGMYVQSCSWRPNFSLSTDWFAAAWSPSSQFSINGLKQFQKCLSFVSHRKFKVELLLSHLTTSIFLCANSICGTMWAPTITSLSRTKFRNSFHLHLVLLYTLAAVQRAPPNWRTTGDVPSASRSPEIAEM